MKNSGMKTLYNRKKKRYCLLLCAGILVFHTIVLCLISKENVVYGQEPKAPVVVSGIVEMEVKQPVKMVGTVFPFRESIIACEIEGLVVEFPVKRGDFVKKGQVLAKLSTITLEIQLKGAKADEHLALLEFQRARELYESHTISNQEFDLSETKLVAQQVVVEGVEDSIRKCTIKAPFEGRITEEFTEIGQWLTEGDRVVSMLQLNSVKIRVPVPERYIQNLSVGDESSVSFPALGGMTRAGNIVHIVPQADSRARTFPVYVKIENEDEIIKSGMFAEVTFETDTLSSSTMILKDGIVRRGGGEFIYLVVDGKVKELPVQTGVVYKNLIQVFGEIKPGLDVVVRGNERLRNGQDILVTRRMDVND